MRGITFISVLILALFSGCQKEKTPATSGTATIESTLHGSGSYYADGFSFSKPGIVSTISTPGPDITLFASKNLDGSFKETSFEASNFENSFSLVGESANEADAIQSFKSLIIVGNVQWIASAKPLERNQIWLFKTGMGRYNKMRIITVVEEMRQNLPYASCTFEWVYQPDGSTTFPNL